MSDSSDSDDDLGAFGFLKGDLTVEEVPEEEEETQELSELAVSSQICQKVDELLLLRDTDKIEALCLRLDESNVAMEKEVCTMCNLLLQGKHLTLLQEHSPEGMHVIELLNICIMEGDCVAQVRNRLFKYVSEGEDDTTRECRAMQSLLVGVTYLELYCQENYTGPELNRDDIYLLYAEKGSDMKQSSDQYEAWMQKVQDQATRYLECDGLFTFPHCSIPHVLLIARSILTTLADPQRANWRRGIRLDEEGGVLKSVHNRPIPAHFSHACRTIHSSNWHCVRAALVHGRLLQKLNYQNVPTLWKETQDQLEQARQKFGCDDLDLSTSSIRRENGRIIVHQSASNGNVEKGGLVGSRELLLEKAMLVTQLMLECGLCQHHFGFGDMGKKYFAHAKSICGLTTELSGAMGKRTKFQQDDHAQLFLRAFSSLHRATGMSHAPSPRERVTPPAPPAEEVNITEGGWQHGEWEVGRGLLREVEASDANGEGGVAAVREVMLDSIDGGPQENILLEGGAKFTNAELERGTELHPIDQAVLLALCIDVSNSNPADGLTREEMEPYLIRLLEVANNWMIHSTGLLERSWLEFEKRRTMDRAMLQIQALLDQHTTKLTMMQSTFKAAVEESAPVQDRIHYLHCIVYPSQYELKRDLAQRYLSCSVVASALQYFRELHMWNEVVTCYQLMQKPHRAEMVVRERIQEEGKTPYMLTALADLTNDAALYEEAWELSDGRYARAKRTLAKISFDNGDMEACVRHATQALEVQPLKATAWYLKGLACIRLERHEDALHALSRCIQQDQDIGEAWANCGSIHMHLGDYQKAHSAMEQAYKHKRDSWRLIENLMNTSLQLGKWADCITYMEKLLDMRDKSGRPWHKDELKRLSLFVTAINRAEAKEKKRLEAEGASSDAINAISVIDCTKKNFMEDLRAIVEEGDSEEIIIVMDADLSYPARRLEAFFFRLSGSLSSDAELWDLFAEFELSLGRINMVLECRVKQYRTLINEPRWEKEEGTVARIVSAAKVLVAVHSTTAASNDNIFECNSLLLSTQRKINELFTNTTHSSDLGELLREIADIAAVRKVTL